MLLFGSVMLHLFATSAALNAHVGLKAEGGRGRTSHGLRASVFRAASASTLRDKGSQRRQAPYQAPLYTPKIGLANVTKPTAYPPPPPSLEPWEDHQPLDTAIGHYLVSGFMEEPTVTPPPTQESMDLAFSCPILLNWPKEVAVLAPTPCASDGMGGYAKTTSGNWSNKDKKELLVNWETHCMDIKGQAGMRGAATALTTYTVSNGFTFDVFGSSLSRRTPVGNFIELIDCGGVTRFKIDEKVYKQMGKPDDESCTKYKSCDGVIYLQYFIKDARGVTVAMTGYNHIFQSSFDITDTTGVKIAHVSRNGWDPIPNEDCSAYTGPELREWNLKFEKSPPGNWGAAVNQWPLAAMMTMLAQRDLLRQPDAQVLWTECEIMKTSGIVAAVAATLFCCICVPCILAMFLIGPCKTYWADWEERSLPRTMKIPSKWSL